MFIVHFIFIKKQFSGPQSSTEPEQQIDYSFAQQELMDKQFSNDPIQEAIEGIVKQHQEDKEGKNLYLVQSSGTFWG